MMQLLWLADPTITNITSWCVMYSRHWNGGSYATNQEIPCSYGTKSQCHVHNCFLSQSNRASTSHILFLKMRFSLISLFWKKKKIKVCLWDLLAVCVSLYPPVSLLNAWSNIYEPRYVYHGTWAHLNGTLHKSLPSGCVSVCVSPYRCYATTRWTRSLCNEYTQQ
jgi:hypothetical protein